MFHGLAAKIRIHAALNDRKQRLRISIQRICGIKMLHTSLQPLLCQSERFLCVLICGIARAALVKSHHNVGSDDTLRIHIVLRSEDMLRSVYVRTEYASVFSKFSDRAEGKHLESAAVGQDRTVPRLELMKSSGRLDDIKSWSEI